MIQPTCLQCGQSIENKRSDAKYCSDRCRMRYRRAKKSNELFTQLIQLCSQIPNHVVQSEGSVLGVVIHNAKKGKHQTIDRNTLKNLPNEELKRLIKRKKVEVDAYKLTNLIS